MTQRAEGNLIGALKKESNLTIKQAFNTVVITLIIYLHTIKYFVNALPIIQKILAA